MKKAFTLLELVISITIFMIILTVLYKVLDETKFVNKNFSKHLQEHKNSNRVYKIFLEDIAESQGKINVIRDKNQNYLVKFKSFNTYHNPFYNNITYLLTLKNNLIRIESKEAFDEKKINQNFFINSYLDILKKDIKKFEVFRNTNKDDRILFSIINKKGEKDLFSTFKMIKAVNEENNP